MVSIDLIDVITAIISNNNKLNVYKSLIRPAIEYGSETWTLNQNIYTRVFLKKDSQEDLWKYKTWRYVEERL